jgi:hypothetical protein
MGTNKCLIDFLMAEYPAFNGCNCTGCQRVHAMPLDRLQEFLSAWRNSYYVILREWKDGTE